MPNPNCTVQLELDLEVLECGRLGRRLVQARFHGGSMTSDAEVMLLSKVDHRLGLLAAAARCIADPRDPDLITHAVHEMLRQRVFGLALGQEDLNDHKARPIAATPLPDSTSHGKTSGLVQTFPRAAMPPRSTFGLTF